MPDPMQRADCPLHDSPARLALQARADTDVAGSNSFAARVSARIARIRQE